ncbi:MAG: hypothetical protein GX605_06530, partial [Chloroflexi bacterium]|nr:hypothetical protein [Chloroflexota bacterium]
MTPKCQSRHNAARPRASLHWTLGGLSLGLLLAVALVGLTAAAAAAPPLPYSPGVYAGYDRDAVAGRNDGLAFPELRGGHMRFTWRSVEPERGVFRWDELDAWIASETRKTSDPTQLNGKKVAFGIVLNALAGATTPPWALTAAYDPVYYAGSPYVNYANANVQAAIAEMVQALAARYNGRPEISFIEICVGVEGEPGVWLRVQPNGLPDPIWQAYREKISTDAWINYAKWLIDAYVAALPDTPVFYFFSGFYQNAQYEKETLIPYAISKGCGLKFSGLRRGDETGGGAGGVCNPPDRIYGADWVVPLWYSDTATFAAEFSWWYYYWDSYWAYLNGLDKGYSLIHGLTSVVTPTQLVDPARFFNEYAHYVGGNMAGLPGIWTAFRTSINAPDWPYCPDYESYEFYLYHDRSPDDGRPVADANLPYGSMRPEGFFTLSTDRQNGQHYFYLDVDDRYQRAATAPVEATVIYYDGEDPGGRWWLQYDAADNPQKQASPVVKLGTDTWLTATVSLPDAFFGGRLKGGNDLRLYSGGLQDDDDQFHMVLLRRPGETTGAAPIAGPATPAAVNLRSPDPTVTLGTAAGNHAFPAVAYNAALNEYLAVWSRQSPPYAGTPEGFRLQAVR